MNDPRQEQFDDDTALDALLAEAQWPEPDPASTRRLAKTYLSQRPVGVSRRWLLAASLLIAGGIAFAAWRWKQAPREIVRNPHSVVPHAVSARHDVEVVAFVARPPTRLELIRVAAAEREARRVKPPKPEKDAVERAVDEAVRSDSQQKPGDAQNLLNKVPPRRRQAELARIIYSKDPARSAAAARLFAQFATVDSIPLLLDMDRLPALRDVAVPALARVCDPNLLENLVRLHPRHDHRQILAAGLLTQRATSPYLELVLDSTTSADALAALDRVRAPSTEGFFDALYDPHISVRLAAARVLGRIDGPQTTARLVAMAQRNQCRREALIALADSRGPEARQFLDEAKTGGPLAGAVRSILLEQSTNE